MCFHPSVSLSDTKNCREINENKIAVCEKTRDLTRRLIQGGVYSYIHVLPDGFILNLSRFQKKPVGHNTNI